MSDVTSEVGAVLAQPNQQSEADAGGIASANSAQNATAPPAPDINDVPKSTHFKVIKTLDKQRSKRKRPWQRTFLIMLSWKSD